MEDFGLLTEDGLLHRYVVRREPAVWEEIGVRNLDRIKGHVATFCFDGGQRIPALDQGELLSLAWLRVMGLGENFRGVSIGELRNAVRTTVWNTCMDWGRRRLAYEKRIAGSLDAPAYGEDDRDGGRFDAQIAERSIEREAVSADEEEAWGRENAYVAMVHEAIARVPNGGYREVLHMTYVRKLDAPVIADRLGISLDNVYQRRRRGNLELEKILRDPETA
jgi:RNA polymerase sigma factor (sigma-70 family)